MKRFIFWWKEIAAYAAFTGPNVFALFITDYRNIATEVSIAGSVTHGSFRGPRHRTNIFH
jgi:hypothetical protein